MKLNWLTAAVIFLGLIQTSTATPPEPSKTDSTDTATNVLDTYPTHGLPIEDLLEAEQGLLKDFDTPTKKLSPEEYPAFSDDLDFENMELAIARQLQRYRQFPTSGTVKFGDTRYPLSQVAATLETFGEVIYNYEACITSSDPQRERICRTWLQDTITRYFDVFAPDLRPGDERYGEKHSTFFTAYYTPTLKATPRPTAATPWGIYAKPQNEDLRKSTRVQIHFENRLAGKGLNHFYTEDLFELYLLHVQGGGRILLYENGGVTPIYIHYDGNNSQPFRFISTYMKEKGYISDGTIEAQRAFLKANPDKQREIYNYCPSYVYYRTSDIPPAGSGGVSVTPRRSIATDRNLYGYKGTLAFIQAQRPKEGQIERPSPEYKPFSRFMLDQDTGGAIKGKGRVDIYHGDDRYAEVAAFNTKHTGNLYFLMLKK